MPKTVAVAGILGSMLLFAAVASATAHEGGPAKIEVEPSTVTAGGSVIIVGSGLEENIERVLVLAGEDLIVEFGTVATDAEGTFQKELTIPSHLPPGTYEFRAIGDETLTVPLGILEPAAIASPPTSAAPSPGSTPASSPGSGPASPAPASTAEPVDPTKTVIPRERTPIDMAAIGAFVLLAVAAGLFLVARAERLGASFRC